MSQQTNVRASTQAMLITRPAAGESASFESQAGGQIAFDFDPSAATVSRAGNDLVFQMDDGGSVTLSRFFEVGDQSLPSLVLPSGDEVASNEFLSAFDIDLETAAGPATGGNADSGGSGEYDDDSGVLVNSIDRLGSLGTLYWGKSTDVTEFPSGNTLNSLELTGDAPEAGGRQGVMALILEITNHPQDAQFKNSYGYYIKQYNEQGQEIAPKEGVIIWADVSDHANLHAQIILDFGEDITQEDIGFFIIPNGGGVDLTQNNPLPLNPELENGTKVVFGEDGYAYIPDQDGIQDVQLKGQNNWKPIFDTDSDYIKEGYIDGQEGNQHWEDLPKDFAAGEWFDHDDVNITVNWAMKNVVYNTDGDETLSGSGAPDLFVWDSSVLNGIDIIENFDCSMDKLLFNGLLNGDSSALNTLLGSGSWNGDSFTATGGGTTFNLSIAGDTATLQLTTSGITQTIEIEGGIQPFKDAAADTLNSDTATATLLQQIISISG